MYGTHTLAFQRIFVRVEIISLIFIRFSYVALIRNSVTGPLHEPQFLRRIIIGKSFPIPLLLNELISLGKFPP